MIHTGLEEYCEIKMNKEGMEELIELIPEFLSISKKHISLAYPHYRLSKLLRNDDMKKYHKSIANGHLGWAETNYGIAIQIAITLFEWKEKLKRI